MKPRLLVLEMHHLGDAVMSLPFLRAAVRTHETTVLCRDPVADFLRNAAPGCRVIGCADWGGVAGSLPSLTQADAAVCAWPDSRAHLMMRRSGAGTRVGFRVCRRNFYGIAHAWRLRRMLAGAIGSRLVSLRNPLLTHPLERLSGTQPHMENWDQIASALGWAQPDGSAPWLPLGQADPQVARFADSARAAGMRVAVMHAGGRLPGKRWPLPRFQDLLENWFQVRRIAVIIVQVPDEPCPEAVGPHQMVWPSKDPWSLAPVLALADGVLANDSFAAHLAAAVGRPVVTIFGSGDPDWFSPRGNRHLVAASGACRYRPCVDRCVQPNFLCLESLSIHLVAGKLSAMFPDHLPD